MTDSLRELPSSVRSRLQERADYGYRRYVAGFLHGTLVMAVAVICSLLMARCAAPSPPRVESYTMVSP